MSRFIQCDGPECDEVMKDFSNSHIEGWILMDLDVGRPEDAQEPARTITLGAFELPLPGERISDKYEGQFHSWQCLSDWAKQQEFLWEAAKVSLGG